MADQHTLQFEQFYFGNLVSSENRASARTGVVARTASITSEHAKECVQLAKLRPPMPDEASDAMPSALGLFKGSNQSADFILAKAQRNTAGLPQLLYLLVPSSALRTLGGNVEILHALGMAEMPSFSQVNKQLDCFTLSNAIPLDDEQQNEALMDLLIYCQDSFATVEGLLAAVVQGWPLAIINSPAVLEKRLRFLQGMLSLLPPPARSGITFATHVSDFETGQAQIKFSSKPDIPEQHVVFDWQKGTLRSVAHEHNYSRYIVAQLRLDTSRVIEETERLARTAVWRAMHRENLGKALEWVSRRAALDQTVRNGQPADREMVAAVLREDPTLPPDLRPVYVRHVLAFALALKEPASADVVAAQCATFPELQPKVIEQLRAALEDNHPRFIYRMLERWILRVPEASAEQWHDMLHTAATTHFETLLQAGQVKRAQRFLAYLHKASPALRLQDIMCNLALTASDWAQLDVNLAQQIFLLGTECLSTNQLQDLLKKPRLVSQLPDPLQAAIIYLQTPAGGPPPQEHLLHHGARVFGDGYRMRVLARLVELAVSQKRPELLDTPALQALLVMTQSPQSEQHHTLIHRVIDDLIEADSLRQLAPPGPRVLIQLMLQTHDYEHAVAMLEYYQNSIFGTDNLDEFGLVVSELFSLVALPADKLTSALKHFENSQIRPRARAMIYASSLMNRQWATDMDYAAKQLTTIIFNDYMMITPIGREHVRRLLEYHARLRNPLDTLRIASALIDHMSHSDVDDAALIPHIWPLITWDQEVTDTAIELLRRYIRGLPIRKAPTTIRYLGSELGHDIETILEATYVMCFIVEDADLFETAAVIHTAAELLTDIATTYHSSKAAPTITRLRRELDTMTGGLNSDERYEIADNMLAMATQIYELGLRHANKWNKMEELERFVKGNAAPKNSSELLYFMGGHFGQQKAHALRLEREEMAHVLGTRSAAMFQREANTVTHLLRRMHQASEQLERMDINPIALHAELNSLWDMLSLYKKRQIQKRLARDCQQLAGVLDLIASNGSDRVTANSSVARQLEIGKRQPSTAMETLRWIHGYFAHKHVH